MFSFSKLALLTFAVTFVNATPTPTTPQEPSLTKRDFTSDQPTGAFTGKPESGIGSWYRSDNAQDYTNGKSWCGYAYYDDSPLFAPSLARMSSDSATYSSDEAGWRQATDYYCGLEANVTNPTNGVSMLLYIGDSFSAPRTAGSIDVMVDVWQQLYGAATSDKDIVIQGLEWTLTGRRNTDWAANN